MLTAIKIYHVLPPEFPPWVFKAIKKIFLSFFWKCFKKAKGGLCLVAWEHISSRWALLALGSITLTILTILFKFTSFGSKNQAQLGRGQGFHVLNLRGGRGHTLFVAATKCTINRGDRVIFWNNIWIVTYCPWYCTQLIPICEYVIQGRKIGCCRSSRCQMCQWYQGNSD